MDTTDCTTAMDLTVNRERSLPSSTSSTTAQGSIIQASESSPTDPNGSQNYWPLVFHEGQVMHLVPNPLVPPHLLPPLPPLDAPIIGFAPANNPDAFFAHPFFWPFAQPQGIPLPEIFFRSAQMYAAAEQRAKDQQQSQQQPPQPPSQPPTSNQGLELLAELCATKAKSKPALNGLLALAHVALNQVQLETQDAGSGSSTQTEPTKSERHSIQRELVAEFIRNHPVSSDVDSALVEEFLEQHKENFDSYTQLRRKIRDARRKLNTA